MIDLVLTHATVITMDPARTILEDGAVAVDQGRIVAVGSTSEIVTRHQATKTIDCRHRVVMPGLVDAHGHGGHSLLKTIAADTGSVWMRVVTPVYFHFVTDEYWYIEGLLSALERLRFGVTCGVSVVGSQPRSDDPVFACNHAKAYAEVGLREVVAVGPCAPPWPHDSSRWVEGQRIRRTFSLDEALAGTEAVIESWHRGAGDRIRVFVTPFTIVPSLLSNGPTPPDIGIALQPSDREQARRIREIAAKYQTRIHSDAFGGMIKLASQDEYGLLGPDVHLQHCHGLSVEEVQIVAETDTRIGHSPGPAAFRCPVPELMQAGATVAITTDGTSPRQSFDLFQAARKAQLLQQVHFRDRAYLPPGKLLEMVTVDAARAVGWEDEIGSLEPGKKADIIVINMRQPHLMPNFMPVHRLIYEVVGNDVETVIVDGKLLMEEGKILTVDEEAIYEAAQTEALALIKRAALEPHMGHESWGQVYQTFAGEFSFPE
jgi:cytosine/adenosine deaminase-related metal-dependent hydrolase